MHVTQPHFHTRVLSRQVQRHELHGILIRHEGSSSEQAVPCISAYDFPGHSIGSHLLSAGRNIEPSGHTLAPLAVTLGEVAPFDVSQQICSGVDGG